MCAAVHGSSSSRIALILFCKLSQISSQLTHLGSRPALVKNIYKKWPGILQPIYLGGGSSHEVTPSTVERGRGCLILARRTICGSSTCTLDELVSDANKVDLSPSPLFFSYRDEAHSLPHECSWQGMYFLPKFTMSLLESFTSSVSLQCLRAPQMCQEFAQLSNPVESET